MTKQLVDKSMKRFRSDQKAIFWVIYVGVSTMLIATTIWLIAMLVTGSFIDLFSTQATGPYTVEFGEAVRTQGSATVVIVDVGMIVWMAVSAFRKERQEDILQ